MSTTDVGQSGHHESPPDERPRRGRPRDPAIEGRALDAARQVVAQRGLTTGTSMTAIADAAGVGKPTLYLRWGNLDELVSAAMHDVDLSGELGALAREALDVLDALEQHDDGRFLAQIMAAGDPWRADLAERLTDAGHGAALPPFDASHERWAVGRRDGWALDGLPGPGYGDPEAPSGD